MDILNLYQSYNVKYLTEGHKHCRPGWVNVPCPFCTGNPGYHLGVTMDGSHFYCWRCGWKPTTLAVSRILGIPQSSAYVVIQEFGGVSNYVEPTNKIGIKEFKLPSNIHHLEAKHKRYLESRGFDPDKLERKWGLLATDTISLLDGINYAHRIFIPVNWDFQLATFQCRDFTDHSGLKYIACPQTREVHHHKHILYGKPEKWKSTGICVEGVTDVWRFGENSFATFGIKTTQKQIRLMAKRFKRIAVAYDFEPQAQEESKKLISELRFRGVDAFHVPIHNDPGSMDQGEADYLVRQILPY